MSAPNEFVAGSTLGQQLPWWSRPQAARSARLQQQLLAESNAWAEELELGNGMGSR